MFPHTMNGPSSSFASMLLGNDDLRRPSPIACRLPAKLPRLANPLAGRSIRNEVWEQFTHQNSTNHIGGSSSSCDGEALYSRPTRAIPRLQSLEGLGDLEAGLEPSQSPDIKRVSHAERLYRAL